MALPSANELLPDFELYLVGKGKSPETVKTYLAYARIATARLEAQEVSLLRANARNIAHMLAGAEWRRNTIRNLLGALRAFYRFTAESGWRADDPTSSMSLRKDKLQPRQPFSRDELQALLRTVMSPHRGCRSPEAHIVDLAMLRLLINTGLRIGELVRLTIQQIDFDGGTVLIRGKGSKERWEALDPVTLAAIRAVANGRLAGPLFLGFDGKPLGRERARKRLEAVGRRAGVTPIYPHRFRITFANLFMEEDGDLGALQVLMGHANISETAHYSGFHAAKRALEKQRRFEETLRFEAPAGEPEG